MGSKLAHSADSKKPKHAETAEQNTQKAKKKPVKKARIAIIGIIAVVIIGAIAATIGIVKYNEYRDEKKAQPFKFSQKLSVSGINISGLSEDEARKKLENNRMSAVTPKELTLNANNKSQTLTENDFGYSFNYDKALNSAKIYSLKDQWIYDESEETEATEYSEPSITKDGTKDFALEYELKDDTVAKAVKIFAKKANIKPQNAEITKFHPFSKKRFEYKEGTDGALVDTDELTARVTKALNSDKKTYNLDAKVNITKPKIDINFLKKNIVGLSTATSTSYNTQIGTNNMALALSSCNGSVIKPGKVWSFNNCTGNSNLTSNGYGSSTVIVNGQYTQGVGGGICQASTVIFQAAILGNVDIYERHYHYYTSSYALSGEDATIDYPNLDLKLRNKSKFPIFLECRVVGTTLTANFYGYQSPKYDNVKMSSENYDVTGYNYHTKTYRTLYLKDKEVKSEIVAYSTYSLSGGHYVKDADTAGTFRKKPDKRIIATEAPTEATNNNSDASPTQAATNPPTQAQTQAPTQAPTAKPKPTQAPTAKPKPTQAPTAKPKPTQAPTNPPTQAPTDPPADEEAEIEEE